MRLLPSLGRGAALALAAAPLALAPPAAAQPAPAGEDLDARVVELAGELVGKRGSPGVVIGLIAEGRQRVFALGKPAADSEAVLDGDSLFEIGSITKVFTSLALAHLVVQGSVRLEDPVASLLPEAVSVPRGSEREIRLVDLATHHSGLPRLPDNMRPKNPLNPYADYTVEQLYEFLGSHELRREPGAEYEYSNLAMGLLGHALALHAGTDYEELVRKSVLEPLGMRDTAIELSDAQRARLSRAHLQNGIATLGWDLPTLAGAGALRSSVHDLLKLAAACLERQPEGFAAALELTMEPRRELDPGSWVGLGWHIEGDGEERVWWHNGATGGYSSYLGFQPARRVAVVVLCNRQLGGGRLSPKALGDAVARLVP